MNTCCYCGIVEASTRDHIAPKALFSKPRPNDLITVPACTSCHSTNWSKDDEYFRNMLCLSQQCGGHPEAVRASAAVLRSLHRPEALGLRRSLSESTIETWRRSPAGILVEKALAFQVDLARLHGTVARIVRGLYFHKYQQILNPEYEVRVVSDPSLQGEPPEFIDELQKTIVRPLLTHPATRIADDAFFFRSERVEREGVVLSVWALTFYCGVSFLAFTGPPTSQPDVRADHSIGSKGSDDFKDLPSQ